MKKFETREVSAIMLTSIILLVAGLCLFSILGYASKINLHNLPIYLIAIGAYFGFSILFIRSVSGNNNLKDKKRSNRI